MNNRGQTELTPQQLLYAANDAYAALKVLEALNLPREDLPIMGSDTHAAMHESAVNS